MNCFTINSGLFWTSLYILEIYSPIIPRNNNWIEATRYMLNIVDDQPNGAIPESLLTRVYTVARKKSITPAKPVKRHILIGKLESEKKASNPRLNNFQKFVFASPLILSGLEYSILPWLNPIKDLSPGRYLLLSLKDKKAFKAFLLNIEKLPTSTSISIFIIFLKSKWKVFMNNLFGNLSSRSVLLPYTISRFLLT